MDTTIIKTNMKIIYLALLLSCVCNINAQVNFIMNDTLLDMSHYSYKVVSLSNSDLNNDGFEELIVASGIDDKIMFYKNINGNLQHHQRSIVHKILNTNVSSSRFDISSDDLDGDGLNDIVVASGYEDELYYFKNLGNYSFSNKINISNGIDNPRALKLGDIDNDGDIDLVVGLYNDKNVSLYRNNGDGTFSNQEVLFSFYSCEVLEIKLVDIDNNGFLDIVSGNDNGSIVYSKNIDGDNFTSFNYITYNADDGTGFDFLDINNDSYVDIVYSSNYDDNLRYSLNQSGMFLTSNDVLIGNISNPYKVKIYDMDDDGISDIIVSTSNKLVWYKNNNNSSFSSSFLIADDISNPEDFLIGDINNNGQLDLVIPSHKNGGGGEFNYQRKLSILDQNNDNTFNETILNFYFNAFSAVEIADLDNDGLNDIISANSGLVWNKNLGNNEFSSQILIGNKIEDYYIDIDLMDLDADGLLDIVATHYYGIDIYKNNSNGDFQLMHSVDVPNRPLETELGDINSDGSIDIVFSIRNGDDKLATVIHQGNFIFQGIDYVFDNLITYFKPNEIKLADMDNDNDIDIITSSAEYSRVQMLENEGSGNFTFSELQNISTDPIELIDFDNDGDLDIITSGSRNHGYDIMHLIINDNGTFNNKSVIDLQYSECFSIGDINNDGFMDIVGASIDYPYEERLFCYLGNGTSSNWNKFLIEDVQDFLSNSTKDTAVGDINNDGLIDIAITDFIRGYMKYFSNNSTLNINDFFNNNKFTFKIFPNPSNEIISWDENLEINTILVYDIHGKIILKEKINDNSLLINNLSNGVYFLRGVSKDIIYNSKLVVN